MNNTNNKNTNPNPNLHALLIGIDFYFPNKFQSDDGYNYSYQSLGGCVRDISHIEDYLIRTVKVPSENIVKLTSNVF